MSEQQFAYWLQGFAELTGDTPPTAAQWKSIREHLELVFTKVTPKVTIQRAPVDLKDSPEIKELLEKARQQLPVPYVPGFWQERSSTALEPGVAIC
jgi:hypothetical protein